VIAACPDLTPMESGTFPDYVRKVIELAGLYRTCQAAALAGSPSPED
jgi:hypothetical protein